MNKKDIAISKKKRQIAKQEQYISTWSNALVILENNSAEEAVKEMREFIQEKIDKVQEYLDKNKLDLIVLETIDNIEPSN